jgi:hypothetical protein
MELAFSVVWGCMGCASKGERFVGELKGTTGAWYGFEIVEVGSFMFIGVYLERKELNEL